MPGLRVRPLHRAGVGRGGGAGPTSTSILRAASGIEVLAFHRRYQVQGDRMRYKIHMATQTPLTLHLTGTLTRA